MSIREQCTLQIIIPTKCSCFSFVRLYNNWAGTLKEDAKMYNVSVQNVTNINRYENKFQFSKIKKSWGRLLAKFACIFFVHLVGTFSCSKKCRSVYLKIWMNLKPVFKYCGDVLAHLKNDIWVWNTKKYLWYDTCNLKKIKILSEIYSKWHVLLKSGVRYTSVKSRCIYIIEPQLQSGLVVIAAVIW